MAKLPINLIGIVENGGTETESDLASAIPQSFGTAITPIIWNGGLPVLDSLNIVGAISDGLTTVETVKAEVKAILLAVASTLDQVRGKSKLCSSLAYNANTVLTDLEVRYAEIKAELDRTLEDLDRLESVMPDVLAEIKGVEAIELSEYELNMKQSYDSLAYLEKMYSSSSELSLSLDEVVISAETIGQQLIKYVQNMMSNAKSYEAEINRLGLKISAMSKLSISVSRNLSAFEFTYETVIAGLASLSEKQDLAEAGILEYRKNLQLILQKVRLLNATVDSNTNALMVVSETLHEDSCYLNEKREEVNAITANCDHAKALLDEYYDLLVGGNFLEAGDNVKLGRSGCAVVVNGYLPILPQCPLPPIAPPVGGDIFVNQGPLPECPPPICPPPPNNIDLDEEERPTTTPPPPKKCKFKLLDDNANRVIDDDLDLYIDGVFIKEMKGSVNPSTTHEFEMEEGPRKIELKFKKSNGKHTAKEIYITNNKGENVFAGNVGCSSNTPKGTVIFSAVANLRCG